MTNEEKIKKELEALKVQNGLTTALLGPGQMQTTQLSQVDTLFQSNRWYMVSNMRQLLSQIYVEHGIIQTLVDIPVDDAFRGGVDIITSQLDADEIEEVQNKIDREGDIETVAQAQKWNRLFGGGAILIITGQDYKKEFKVESIKKGDQVAFKALDLWELFFSKQNVSDDEEFDLDTTESNLEFYDYYSKSVHKSRVLRLVGLKAPSFVRPRLRGWGFSIIESVIRPVNQYLKATELVFENLDEFKIDIFKIKGLADTLLRAGGEEAIQKRVQLAAQQKNYQNAISMDGDDDYIQKQINFAGLAEVMDGIRKQLASDLRIPMTKLFGTSSAGFNSGEDDIENYNAMVESTVRAKTKFEVQKLVEIRCQQLFGMVPDDLKVEFKPLRVLSSNDEQTVKTSKFNRLLQARQAGEISAIDFKEGVNKEDLLPVKIDVSDETFEVALPTDAGATAPPQKGENLALSKNSNMRQVACVGITSGGYILTGQRKDNNKWTFPAGHLEDGEAPLDGAARETEEESGITNIKQSLQKLTSELVTTEEGETIQVHPFRVELDGRIMPETINDPDSEILVWRWVPISQYTTELLPESRHAKNDLVLKYIFKGE